MKPTVIIFHGLCGSSEENWFPWLKKELEKDEFEVEVPDLPKADNPSYKAWKKHAMPLIIDSPGQVILIGHSLGATLILNLLAEEKQTHKKIKHALLIAPPLSDLGWPELKKFFRYKFDYSQIEFDKLLFKYSHDDPHVEIPEITILPRHASVLMMHGFGHFTHKEFPLITKFINL